jgi:hypothetical protein
MTMAPGATPILDRLEPLPRLHGARRLQFRTWAPISIGVAIGVALPFVDVQSRLAPLQTIFRTAINVVEDAGVLQTGIIVFATLFLAVAIHEAGHAIAGWLAGFMVHSVRIWRLQVELPLKLSIYRGPNNGAGGWVVCAPRTTDHLAARAGVMLAAGPAANLVSGLMVYPFARSTSLMSVAFVAWSLMLGVVNLLPLRTGPLFSDGYRILMLLFDRARGERWLALLKLSKDVLDGVRPESFSEEFLRVATAVNDESSDTVSAHSLAYAAAFRGHRCDEAARHLEACLRYSSRTSAAFQHALMADAASFHGRCRRNPDLAEAWLRNMPARTQVAWHRLWAEAGVLHARGDRDGTLAKLDEIEREIRRQPSPFQKFSLGGVECWRDDLAIPG